MCPTYPNSFGTGTPAAASARSPSASASAGYGEQVVQLQCRSASVEAGEERVELGNVALGEAELAELGSTTF